MRFKPALWNSSRELLDALLFIANATQESLPLNSLSRSDLRAFAAGQGPLAVKIRQHLTDMQHRCDELLEMHSIQRKQLEEVATFLDRGDFETARKSLANLRQYFSDIDYDGVEKSIGEWNSAVAAFDAQQKNGILAIEQLQKSSILDSLQLWKLYAKVHQAKANAALMRQEAEQYLGEVSKSCADSEFECSIRKLVRDCMSDVNSQIAKLTQRFRYTVFLYSMIVIVSSVCWVSFVYIPRHRDQRDWEQALRAAQAKLVDPSEAIAANDKYLDVHATGHWAGEARERRIKLLEAQDQYDWEQAVRVAQAIPVSPSEVIAAQEKYLAAHPKGRWADEAQDRSDWERAVRAAQAPINFTGAIDAHEKYLTAHPKGHWTDAAKQQQVALITNLSQVVTDDWKNCKKLGYEAWQCVSNFEKERMKDWQAAAKSGNPIACFLMGAASERNEFSEESEKWYQQAAKAGMTEAMLSLAHMYRDALEKGYYQGNASKAAYWYRKSAEAGSPEGMYESGMNYLKVHGVEENKKEGEKWLRKAAASKDERYSDRAKRELLAELGILYD